jgi:steroid 5-alpha reductase family enzyme
MTSIVLMNLVLIGGMMIMLWIIGSIRNDVSLVDPFWGTGFLVVAWVTAVNALSLQAEQLLIVTMTTIWGMRLSLYLIWRNWGHAEDRRYAAMRAYHGKRFWLVSLGTVFFLQGLIMWIVSMPIQIAISNPQMPSNPWLTLMGITLWMVGLFFETVGDLQLARFKANSENANRVMNQGLWRYTRHPNYFGDFCVWWGLYLVCAALGAWWTVFSPLLMSFLLLRVSGVTLLEQTITTRRPDYAEYQSRTSAFFPWKPRQR